MARPRMQDNVVDGRRPDETPYPGDPTFPVRLETAGNAKPHTPR
jgi:hypothetical protein